MPIPGLFFVDESSSSMMLLDYRVLHEDSSFLEKPAKWSKNVALSSLDQSVFILPPVTVVVLV